MAKTRAYGADCILLAAFETVYGTLPADGYARQPSGDSIGIFTRPTREAEVVYRYATANILAREICGS